MITKRSLTPVQINRCDIFETLRNCYAAKTWSPHALGLFGTKKGGVIVERLPKGALALPTKPVHNSLLTETFEPNIHKRFIKPSSLTIYDMYEPEEGFTNYSMGRIYLLVTATLPNFSKAEFPNYIEVPANEMIDRLQVNKAAFNHIRTSIAMLATREYINQQTNVT